MMQFLSNHGQFRTPFRRRTVASLLDIVTSLLFLISCLPSEPVSALYLQQTQPMSMQNQQQPGGGPANQVPDSGAIMQALSQYAAQQMVTGGLNGGLQLTATSSPTGGISISNNNNQQVALVNNNANASNQTMVASQVGGAPLGQQQQVGGNQFVIKFIHNDPKSGLAYVSIMPANYNNTHEPRIELRYQSKYPWVSLPECSANNTVVAGVIVNDEDQGPAGETSLAIEHGNELGHFKLVSTGLTNTIQVNGPLSRREKAEYNLTIVARDHGSPPKASSSTLVIKLHNPMQGFAFGCPQASPAPQTSPVGADTSHQKPVTDLMYVGTMLVIMFSAFIILIIIVCALVQRPSQKVAKPRKGGPPTRTTSATNSRIVPPTDQCSAYCLNSGYDLSNLNI